MTLLAPSHPGEILKLDVIDELNITVTQAADRLGISRVALSRILNKKAGISTDLALRLEKAGISTADMWLNLQMNYDLSLARQSFDTKVESLVTVL